MSKLINLRDIHLSQIAESWENLHSIYYWGLESYDDNLYVQDMLKDFRQDAARLRKVYNISIKEIQSAGELKHSIKYGT